MKDIFCYIHIPFCSSKCKYCRFASFWNMEMIKINLYVENLIKEIKMSSYSIWDKNLKSIYFWWWTPSILSLKQLSNIINELKNKYDFHEKIEINIEATPITINKENLVWWKNMWINRLSIWVQSLNSNALKEIWRWEKWDIIKSLDNIKILLQASTLYESDQDYFNISIDFIIWLPYVKKWEIKKDIEYILDNYPFIKHISIYMLEEYYEKWIINDEKNKTYSKFQNIVYPNDWKNIWITEEQYLWEYLEIKLFLASRWFFSYEISNFCKVWYECKHNESYWNHSDVIAYWLWAHWFLNNIRFSNSEEFYDYYSWIKKTFEILDENDLFLEKIMFWLRTNWLDKELYEYLNINKIQEFIDEWLLHKNDDLLKITDKWVLLLDYVLWEII